MPSDSFSMSDTYSSEENVVIRAHSVLSRCHDLDLPIFTWHMPKCGSELRFCALDLSRIHGLAAGIHK